MTRSVVTIILLITSLHCSFAQQPSDSTAYWHGIERTLRYHPDGSDIVITNGKRRFTRALYGTNTAFRVEAGDLPEFALYLPGMGGNIKFGLTNEDTSKWLIDFSAIVARYRAGSMLYNISDSLLGKGQIHLHVLPLGDGEGVLIKMQVTKLNKSLRLAYVYGGASGKKFSRDGDMGPDPESSFYLKPAYTTDNSYALRENNFQLKFGTGLVAEWDPYVNKTFASDTIAAVKVGKEQIMEGLVPPAMQLKIGDAASLQSPATLLASGKTTTPVLVGNMALANGTFYFLIKKPGSALSNYSSLEVAFKIAEEARRKIADRVIVHTPDSFLNTLGPVLSIAADAIWESPTYLHGAIGWRMRLPGWRGPYVGDVLGWHDRAKTHFKAYAESQVTTPLSGPVVMDTALNLARSLEKMGTSVYSSGYIARNPGGDIRPHHYDMNLVYIDALFRHFKWTGDLQLAKEMWPVITRHLAWEKRNFDADNDGLYDAYAAIWASDALQYSGGAVTHSSAYNYKANKEAAAVAKLIGENALPFEAEAAKILAAMNKTLWVPEKGIYAEFKDRLGNKLLHNNPAVWTIYHAMDSDVPDAFQAYQLTNYIDKYIPHIPVKAKGIGEGFATISTSKWMPYDWSLNNVATAEVMNTALAFWQAGRKEKAFHLWKSELLSTMYLGGSPGNIGQISFYDAARGEAYRDFSDPVAMTARALVEGLFGITPDALHKQLLVKPGFPREWNFASLETPDISISFNRKGKIDEYQIIQSLPQLLTLELELPINGSVVRSVLVNGKMVQWKHVSEAVGEPRIRFSGGMQKKYLVTIVWGDSTVSLSGQKDFYIPGNEVQLRFPGGQILGVKHFSNQLIKIKTNGNVFTASASEIGKGSGFIHVKKGLLSWWVPIHIHVKPSVEIIEKSDLQKGNFSFSIINHQSKSIDGQLQINEGAIAFTRNMTLLPGQPLAFNITQGLIPGTNTIRFAWDDTMIKKDLINWNITNKISAAESIDLDAYFNDKVNHIFKHQYLSPRPPGPTLQLPTQGIGDWTHPVKTAVIDDSGLRKLAGSENKIILPQGIPFNTPGDSVRPNIAFVSQWDNFPNEMTMPLQGKAAHAYFLMAGSTNPMQSRMDNGAVIIHYADKTADTLLLKNPENWYPIEQDYLQDGYAFNTDAPRPVRIHLKTGKIYSVLDQNAEAFSGKMIEGGAATVLDLPLDKNKTLHSLELKAITNDVIIGLMAVTLVRSF